ncbi:hypothetical protein K8374_18260 [Pseudomonas sp. p1(2021b)]|uniref:hypothetical protein n=1 Tax=Pseudomonas sp. p1(2021b) TaxID=2874628 RepID=UPI001CCF95CF|nr:hypothetical protein [Pseudomonas sp. p1(2021b)]UBM24299.1 hypothetical protein K8374_18260 [Pseudomonas sp. p1(2021b)]
MSTTPRLAAQLDWKTVGAFSPERYQGDERKESILTSPLHIICTMRSKTKTVQGEGKKILKLGMKSEQRDGSDYEFTVVLDLLHDGNVAVTTKDRTRLFDQPEVVSPDTGRRLLAWLNDGKSQADLQAAALDDAMSKIPITETMQELQSVFSAAYRVLEQSPQPFAISDDLPALPRTSARSSAQRPRRPGRRGELSPSADQDPRRPSY